MAEQENRKLRPLYIAKYLMQKADSKHSVTAREIMDHLYAEFDISVDRRTIYKDIAMLRDVFGMDIEEAPYGGYYLNSRQFELDDLRMLAECVYAAKFISEEKSKELIDVLCEFCSERQAKDLQKDVYLCDRVKTTQNSTLNLISTIRSAMDSSRFRSKKISFTYVSYSIVKGRPTLTEKHNGKIYTVSPHKLVINDGNYYLLAHDTESNGMRTFRIDRMRKVTVLDERSTGYINYRKMHIETYIRRSFSMFSGERTKVEIRFENSLLDAVIDKFGIGFGAVYQEDGDDHFIVTADVEVSDQFFAWIFGFGTKVKILAPEKVTTDFKIYLSNITAQYAE